MSGPSALLFDLDGTLVDSHHEITLALERALIAHGFDLGYASVARLVDGSPLELIWLKLDVRHRVDSAAFTYFADSYRTYYVERLGHASSLFPGVAETLAVIAREAPAVALCVASNKSAATVAPLLEACGIAGHFRLAMGAGGTRLPPKPAPELLLHMAAELGVSAPDCVMVGDTVLDIEAGKRAGMRTAAVSYGMAERSALERATPDFLFRDFREVRGLLSE